MNNKPELEYKISALSWLCICVKGSSRGWQPVCRLTQAQMEQIQEAEDAELARAVAEISAKQA